MDSLLGGLLVHCFQLELEFKILVLIEGGKPEDPEKTLGARSRTTGNRTRATVLGGRRSHQCSPKNTTGAAILNPNRILTQVAGSTTLLYCILCLPLIAIIFKRLSASRLDYKSITVGALVFADYRKQKWESLYQKAYSEYNFNDITDIILYLFVFT